MSEWLSENRMRVLHVIAVLWTPFFYVSAFPPIEVAEGAFVFLIPLLWWLRLRPSYKAVAWTSLLVGWASWVVLIFWLRHVTFAGMVLLAGVMGLFFMLWTLGTAWLSRRLASESQRWEGLVFALGAAALWVVLEHGRSWFLTGFPWLPLAASQSNRPVMLQGATVFGQWGISFMLTLFNVGVAAYMIRIVAWAREKKKSYCPEFYVALGTMVAMSFLMTRLSAGSETEPLFHAGVVQPLVPQDQKWDSRFAKKITRKVELKTAEASRVNAEERVSAIFWPEAVLPYPLNGDSQLTAWAERLADEVETPIFAGAIGVRRPEALEAEKSPLGYHDEDRWYNSVFLIRPEWGLYPKYYSKRHLVPFGEYVPLRALFPWLGKIVPLDGDFFPGESPLLLPLDLEGRTLKIGSLICFEDVFPALAREANLGGAGLFYVATNSAWYGRSGAAAQHKAHSVLRAVENRRVVLRVGNDAWTGWINEYGQVVQELPQWREMGATFEMSRDGEWKGRFTFYAKHGDWFVWVCFGVVALCVGFGVWVERRLMGRDG